MSDFRFDFKPDPLAEPVAYVVIDADDPRTASLEAQKQARDGEIAVPANVVGDERHGTRVDL